MSSNCDKALLMDFLYEELSEVQAQRFNEHVATCEECAQEFHSLKDARTLLGLLPQQEIVEKLVFTATPKRTFQAWMQDAVALLPQGKAGRLAFGFSGALVALLLIGSLSNFQMNYNDSGLKVSMGVLPQAAPALDETTKQAILAQIQSEQQVYVDQYLTNALLQQEQKLNSRFTSFDRLVNRRLSDNFETLRLEVGSMRLTSDARYSENKKRFDNLYRQAAFRPRN